MRPLPQEPWQRAVEATETADVMVVVGTSAIVYPAAGLPDLALARGTAVIEVNPEPTPLSGSATISIRESASQALPGLLGAAAGAAEVGRALAASEPAHRSRFVHRIAALSAESVGLRRRSRRFCRHDEQTNRSSAAKR